MGRARLNGSAVSATRIPFQHTADHLAEYYPDEVSADLVPSAPLANDYGALRSTPNRPPSLLPCTAGLYISSACAGGRTNVPEVVARAT